MSPRYFDLLRLSERALAQEKVGDYRAAIRCHEEVLEALSRSKEDRQLVAGTHMMIGRAYQKLEDAQQALAHHTRCLAIVRELHADDETARTLVNLADAHLSLGQREKAAECLEEAHGIFDRLHNRDQAYLTLLRLLELEDGVGGTSV